jgi:uncharacterized protein
MIRRFTAHLRHIAVGLSIVLALFVGAFAQKEYPINVIQGDKNVSPYDTQMVRTSGIVTARTRTGFFIQTPDDKIDSSPNTSEAIFVYTREEPGAEATIGNMVLVSGQVEEFRPRAEPASLPITEISMRRGRDLVRVLSQNNPLPKPVTLTADDFKLNSIDQLERYEGMRVHVVELTVVSPTGGRVDNKNNTAESNGVFYGILKGLAKPFREPGIDVYDFLFLGQKEQAELRKAFPRLRFFDSNPERLRIESTAQLGSQAIDVAAFTELKNLTGVMHYAYRCYAILTDATARPSVAGSIRMLTMPDPTDRQLTVASMNLENFFDDQDDPAIQEEIVTAESFAKRMKKISLGVRTIMQSPDIIGIVEAENLAALKRLADKINADAIAAGKPDPKYQAYLEDGNDGRGIDNGFLVKTSRVKVIEVNQFGKSDKYTNPDTKQENFLNDRPPLMLRASVEDTRAGRPFEVTVVVNHLKSFLGYDDPKQMANVRLKKRLQAEFLAKFVAERQKANPKERIILVGDFNAFQFSDGIVDVIGAIKGRPAAKDEVMNPSDDLLDPDMINLVDLIIADQRYSYRFDGHGQVLDHILISDSLKNHVHGFGYARMNADFPAIYRNDENRAERFSDHDAPVAYLTLDERVVTPPPTRQP